MNRPRLNTIAGCDPRSTAECLSRLCPLRPRLAIILGSGFAEAKLALKEAREIPHATLPGWPKPSVSGHTCKIVVGKVGSAPVLLLGGRVHFYEGHPMEVVTFPVRVLAEFGIRDLLLTNAAGGISPRFRPGDFMVLTDHINFMGGNPLRGAAPPGLDRFVDLSQVYDTHLTRLLKQAARKAAVRIHTGIYLAVSGPTYETPAEIRAFSRLGADAVGMSTVPEAIVARQHGIAVAGLSCITNLAASSDRNSLSHAEVLAVARRVVGAASNLLNQFLKRYARARLGSSD